MVLEVSQAAVNGIDWGIIALSGAMLTVSAVGAGYSLRFGFASSKRGPTAKEYNRLWRVRCFTEVLAGMYALTHLLRLQVLWGPASVFRQGGYFPNTFCRVYIAATYGIFEPAFLLLALFACHYSVQGRESTKNPNFNIVLFSAGFSLPSCAGQLVAALFTRIFQLDYGGSHMLTILFSTADTSLAEHCPPDTREGSCAFCVFPLLSLFISALFGGVYLLALWVVTQRIVGVVINKTLVRRVRLIQVRACAPSTFLLPLLLSCPALYLHDGVGAGVAFAAERGATPPPRPAVQWPHLRHASSFAPIPSSCLHPVFLGWACTRMPLTLQLCVPVPRGHPPPPLQPDPTGPRSWSRPSSSSAWPAAARRSSSCPLTWALNRCVWHTWCQSWRWWPP